MWRQANDACHGLESGSEAYAGLDDLRTRLRELLAHYEVVLRDHDLPLPFEA